MAKVQKLTNFFEGLSGGSIPPVQRSIQRPNQYGILADKKSSLHMQKQIAPGQTDISNIDNEKGVTDKSQYALQNQVKSMFATVYKNIPNFFKAGSQQKNTRSEKSFSSASTEPGVLEIDQNNETRQGYSATQRKRTNLPPSSNEQFSKDKTDNRETSHENKGQRLGSNKNIAFLVCDDERKGHEAGAKTQIDQDNDVMTRQEKNVQQKNCLENSATVCELPRFSLLEGESKTESQMGPDVTDWFQKKSVSTDFELYDNKYDQCHDMKEKKEQNSKPHSMATSRTSGIYSDSNSALDDAHSKLSRKNQKVEHQACRTEQYVRETIAAGRQLTSRMKYPSEPTNIQELSLKTRTLSQEGIVHIKNSKVSIYSGENDSRYSESLTASQFSVLSSEQETRELIADQTKELLAAHAKNLPAPDQRRLKKAKKVLADEGVVFIVDDKGSGSTHLAWDLLSANSSAEKFNLLDFSYLALCLRSKGSVAILLDDAFGATTLDESEVDKCLKYVKMVCIKNRPSKHIKLIFTVKHHIFNKCKEKLADYNKSIVDLEDPKLQLDSDEMFDIMKTMIENSGNELKLRLGKEHANQSVKEMHKGWIQMSEQFLEQVAENALPSGFPKKFKQFLETRSNIRQGLVYFIKPSEDLLNEFYLMAESKDQSDQEKILTLASTTVFGGILTLEKVSSVNSYTSINQSVAKATKKKKKKKENLKSEQKT